MRVEDDFSQRVIAQTGSFSGYRPLLELGSGYLTATKTFKQPLCGNEEGWGPLSPFRYDFTPCFIDVWVAIVAAFGVVAGAGALWWIIAKKPASASIVKDWHFWIKQVRPFSFELKYTIDFGGPKLTVCCHRLWPDLLSPTSLCSSSYK